MEDFDHLLCEKHLNNETLELISAGKFKENGPFFLKIAQNLSKLSILSEYKNAYFFWELSSKLCLEPNLSIT